MHLRTFVLAGVVELAPQTIHPILKETVSVLAKRLGGCDFFLNENSPQLISIAGVIGAGKTTLAEALRDEFNCEDIFCVGDLVDVYTSFFFVFCLISFP